MGLKDEVITTPYTFFATAGSISRVGATPVFVDIDPRTYNISPQLIEARITPHTKAIMPVHLFGQCADMAPIMEIARHYHLNVIEDAAQAIGAEYIPDQDSRQRAGSIGDLGCYSFFPSKNLGGFGDGGMVVGHHQELVTNVRMLRVHGSSQRYHHKYIGANSRLDSLQAAVLLIKLKYLEGWTHKRQENAQRYRTLVSQAGLTEKITLPYTEYSNRHIYNQFVIRVTNRDKLREFLTAQGIGNEVYYPIPLHLQECYRSLGYKPGDMPQAEDAAKNTLALPIYPELTPQMQEYVIEKIASFYQWA